MPRIQAVSSSNNGEVVALMEDIKAERGGKLLLLYKVLLNSPPVAGGWLKLLTAIRQKTTIPAGLRELIILRIAVLNGAAYEFAAHAPIARAEGAAETAIEAMRTGGIPESLADPERAALLYAEEMTRDVKVKAETFAALKRHFDDRRILELTATIAAYNMVSRVLVALEIEAEPH
jgi:4-carboxymuconolactone decarboxylase